MREIKYTPKACTGDDATLEGFVMLTLPTVPQRYRYIEECGFEVDADGNFDVNIKKLAPLAKMVEISEKHYAKVELVVKATGEKVNSFEALNFIENGEAVLFEIAGIILNGFKPSKN